METYELSSGLDAGSDTVTELNFGKGVFDLPIEQALVRQFDQKEMQQTWDKLCQNATMAKYDPLNFRQTKPNPIVYMVGQKAYDIFKEQGYDMNMFDVYREFPDSAVIKDCHPVTLEPLDLE